MPPQPEVHTVRRRYRENTLVLETEYETDSGTVLITDCMPPRSQVPDLVRLVEGRGGRIPMKMKLIIRSNYGSIVPWVRRTEDGLRAIAGPNTLRLCTGVELRGENFTTVAEFTVAAGQRVPFVLTWYRSHKAEPPREDPDQAVQTTDEWWREWSSRCTYRSEWREQVLRSLITLKALTYAPTGGTGFAKIVEDRRSVTKWKVRSLRLAPIDSISHGWVPAVAPCRRPGNEAPDRRTAPGGSDMASRLLDSLEEVGRRIEQGPARLLGLDFDGTLAALTEDPAQASLSLAMRRVLRSLAERGTMPVAILSGRDRADLQGRVGIPGLIYAGNHGLEISGPGFIFIEPTAAECREALQKLAGDLNARLQPITGAAVEDKGLTLSVHDRLVSDAEAEDVRRVVHAALANSSHPFMLTTGDRVYEIRPRANWSRGDAVAWIKTQMGKPEALVIYLGHNPTDEDVFAQHAAGITVKVDGRSETAAHYAVDGPEDVRKFLDWLADRTR